MPGVLRDIASSDVHDWQVTEAAQHYGADIEHHRTRRQAMARAATPQQRVYYSASPSVNWHNEVGSRDIGASFGSSTTSNISQTVGEYTTRPGTCQLLPTSSIHTEALTYYTHTCISAYGNTVKGSEGGGGSIG